MIHCEASTNDHKEINEQGVGQDKQQRKRPAIVTLAAIVGGTILKTAKKRQKVEPLEVTDPYYHVNANNGSTIIRQPNMKKPIKLESDSRASDASSHVPMALVPPSAQTVHIIFVVDVSSSMKKRDVELTGRKNKNFEKISRWEAVFKCIDEFLIQQQEEEQAGVPVVVSLIIFNETARTQLAYMPLNNGHNVREALTNACLSNVPKGGTHFAVGFQGTWQLLINEWENSIYNKKGSTSQNPHVNNEVVVVFLSDGRPGDLNSNPPSTPKSRCSKHSGE